MLFYLNIILAIESKECINGDFIQDICYCYDGWRGSACDIEYCQRGTINKLGDCQCQNGYTLMNHSCRNNCNHGKLNFHSNKIHCNSYQCYSDLDCQIKTGLLLTSCPVKNYPCLCHNSSIPECMSNFTYYMISSLIPFQNTVLKTYSWFLMAFVSCLLFGTKRTYCYHTKTIIHQIIQYFEYKSICSGDCHSTFRWRINDEFSLSLYIIKLAIWLYFIGFLIVWNRIGFKMMQYDGVILFICILVFTCIILRLLIFHSITRYEFQRKYVLSHILYLPLWVIVNILPNFPPNLLGGVFGYIMETHGIYENPITSGLIFEILSLNKFKDNDMLDLQDPLYDF